MINRSKYLDYLIYWAIILIPFSMSIAPAPMNVFMGFLIASFLVKKILKKEPLFVKTPVNIPLILLFLVSCISVFNSIDFLRDSLRGGIFRLLEYIFVFFVLASELKDKKQIKLIILSIGLGAILVSLDGIVQVASGHDFIRGYQPIVNIGLVRATASFKDANTFGIYLSAIAPLIFGLALYYLKGIKKIIALLVSLIILVGITLTYSRPTLLAVYLILFFFAIMRKDRILFASLIIFTLISLLIVPKTVKDWAKQVEYNPLRFMCNDDRIAVYHNSLKMIRAHPFIGTGVGAFMKSYKKYKEFPEYRNVITLDEMKAHNIYLHLAGEIGLIGLGIFLWFLYKLFKEAGNIYKFSSERYLKIITLSLSACLIAFLINGLTESSLSYSRVALIFWYLSGFLLGLNRFTPLENMGPITKDFCNGRGFSNGVYR